MIEKLRENKNFLELGVKNGGSALLLMLCMNSNDHIYLIDHKKSESFIHSINKIENISPTQISYIISKTSDERAIHSLKNSCDFIHIDAGHMYHQVKHDIEQYSPFLSYHGFLVIDDFFQPRWPGVTEAVYDIIIKNSSGTELNPFLIGFNKLYLCRKQIKDTYNKLFVDLFDKINQDFGNFNIIDTFIMENMPVKFIRGSFSQSLNKAINKLV